MAVRDIIISPYELSYAFLLLASEEGLIPRSREVVHSAVPGQVGRRSGQFGSDIGTFIIISPTPKGMTTKSDQSASSIWKA